MLYPLTISNTTPVFEDLTAEQGEPGSDAILRLVVIGSGILKSGDLVLVDANGISIGRDKCYDRRLRLAEMPTSKHHCQIFFSSTSILDSNDNFNPNDVTSNDNNHNNSDETDVNDDDDNNNNDDKSSGSLGSQEAFFIVDNGSQNGTFVNSKRLSESRMSSKPCQLNHMDELEIGSTKFQVHLHKNWTCEACTVTEGNIIDILHRSDIDSNSNNNSSNSNGSSSNNNNNSSISANIGQNDGFTVTQKEFLEIQRRLELNRLKRKYIGPTNNNQKTTKYVDRAALRRETRPDNTPFRRGQIDDEQDIVSAKNK